MSACTCRTYAEWMSRLNGEPSVGYYRNPRCPAHQGDNFPPNPIPEVQPGTRITLDVADVEALLDMAGGESA